MYIKNKKKKIKFIELSRFWDRLKGFKFYLEPITYGIRFPHKKFSTTNFLCQKIDIILTDKDDVVLGLYKECPTEKYIFGKRGVYYTYFLPLNSILDIKIGDKLELKELDIKTIDGSKKKSENNKTKKNSK